MGEGKGEGEEGKKCVKKETLWVKKEKGWGRMKRSEEKGKGVGKKKKGWKEGKGVGKKEKE